MMVKPSELLDCALRIAKLDRSEAAGRAAISRGYYAAFHAARSYHNALPQPGDIRGASGMHQQLLNQLQFPNIPPQDPKFAVSVAISKTLRPACSARVDADYKLELPIQSPRVDAAIEACRQVVNLAAGKGV